MDNRESLWVGQIPKKWQLLKLGSLFATRNEKVSDKDFPPLSVSRGGVVPQMDGVAKTDANNDRKLVRSGDFAINSRSDRKQSCGLARMDGSVSLINTILYLKKSDIIYPEYLDFLLKNYGFAEEFYRWGHGIVADLWTTRWQEMKAIMLPIPPYETQERICEYLIEKSAEIDSLIAVEEAQIETLASYKDTLINEAVTKGIRRDSRFQDTHIKWLGQIPSHWQVLKAKYISTSFRKGSGITKDDLTEDGDVDCVRYADIYTKYDYSFKCCAAKTNLDAVANPVTFGYGDILFTCTGELVEEIGKSVVYLGGKTCFAGGDIIVMSHNQDPLFMGFALASLSSQRQKSYGKAKLKVVHISQAQIGNIFLAVPPIEEQREIAKWVKTKVDDINLVISNKLQKIQLLEQYKKSLIFECVTGKKEVA